MSLDSLPITSDEVDEMVFGGGAFSNGGGVGGAQDLPDVDNPAAEAAARIQALRAASCIKILGKGVIRVVHRVDDAKENNRLGQCLTIEHMQSGMWRLHRGD